MSKRSTPGKARSPVPAPTCPWCSAPLPAVIPDRCPSCLATLRGGDVAEVPGVTRVDVEAILRKGRPAERSHGLMSWLSGEHGSADPSASPEAVAAPPAEVRREMLRLEAAALELEIQARLAAATEIVERKAEPAPLTGEEPREGR